MRTMKTEANDTRMVKPYVRHPYAFVSQEDEEPAPIPDLMQKKRAYFRSLQNPHAYYAVFGEPDSESPTASPTMDLAVSRETLEKAFDEVLKLYKPYVAKGDWERIRAYRPDFLEAAGQSVESAERVTHRLERLKFSLMPEEKVEHNRAPAAKVIEELKRLLG